MKICLTGGIACGKSLLSSFLRERGIEILDADDVVHELIPDPAERRRLAAEVFVDPVRRRALESRLHPLVRARLDEFLSNPRPFRLVVIPLLFETGWEGDFDFIVCLKSSRENQLRRMIAMRGYTRAEAEGRLAAQMPVEEKARRSHYVIENDGTVEDLRAAAEALVRELRARA